jgi:hypothetical protein
MMALNHVRAGDATGVQGSAQIEGEYSLFHFCYSVDLSERLRKLLMVFFERFDAKHTRVCKARRSEPDGTLKVSRHV